MPSARRGANRERSVRVSAGRKISLARKRTTSTAIRRLLVATQLQPRLIPAHYALRTAYKAIGDEQKSVCGAGRDQRIGAENAAVG